MADNLWIGSEELIIVFRNGHHYVLDSYEDYEPVFDGFYDDCVAYLRKRWAEYQESLY